MAAKTNLRIEILRIGTDRRIADAVWRRLSSLRLEGRLESLPYTGF
jgi:hypothetical protein